VNIAKKNMMVLMLVVDFALPNALEVSQPAKIGKKLIVNEVAQ